MLHLKLQFASDLHMELGLAERPLSPAPGADALVLAGDIHGGTRGVDAFADWPVPVIYVPGNHEFYNEHHNKVLVQLPRAARENGGRITVLDMDEHRIGSVRFLGCTLWTDFELFSTGQSARADDEKRAAAQMASRNRIADYGVIRTDSGRLLPSTSVRFHRSAREWLERRLAEPFAGRTVVITHHAPTAQSIEAKFEADILSTNFASRLDHLVPMADLWIHGHVHHSCDYSVNGTRVVCNPRGYPPQGTDRGDLNPAWQPLLTVAV